MPKSNKRAFRSETVRRPAQTWSVDLTPADSSNVSIGVRLFTCFPALDHKEQHTVVVLTQMREKTSPIILVPIIHSVSSTDQTEGFVLEPSDKIQLQQFYGAFCHLACCMCLLLCRHFIGSLRMFSEMCTEVLSTEPLR